MASPPSQAARKGPRSIEAVLALHSVAGCLQRLGRAEEAEKHWVRALELIDKQVSEGIGDKVEGMVTLSLPAAVEGMGTPLAATPAFPLKGPTPSVIVASAKGTMIIDSVVVMAVLQSLAGCRYGFGRLAEVRLVTTA